VTFPNISELFSNTYNPIARQRELFSTYEILRILSVSLTDKTKNQNSNELYDFNVALMVSHI
jgi:hypothetical protein